MPKIEIKNAVAAWKKVKPMMLTKTGVSEALRPVQTYDPKKMDDVNKWQKALADCRKVLEVAAANKHIAAHKAAHECVKDILNEVRYQINALTRWQSDMNKTLKQLSELGTAFLKAPSTDGTVKMKATLKTYNFLFTSFTPTKIELVQSPTRVLLCAENVMKTKAATPQHLPRAMQEMTTQVGLCSKLRI